jgi:hypothetical protein
MPRKKDDFPTKRERKLMHDILSAHMRAQATAQPKLQVPLAKIRAIPEFAQLDKADILRRWRLEKFEWEENVRRRVAHVRRHNEIKLKNQEIKMKKEEIDKAKQAIDKANKAKEDECKMLVAQLDEKSQALKAKHMEKEDQEAQMQELTKNMAGVIRSRDEANTKWASVVQETDVLQKEYQQLVERLKAAEVMLKTYRVATDTESQIKEFCKKVDGAQGLKMETMIEIIVKQFDIQYQRQQSYGTCVFRHDMKLKTLIRSWWEERNRIIHNKKHADYMSQYHHDQFRAASEGIKEVVSNLEDREGKLWLGFADLNYAQSMAFYPSG